MFKKLKKYIFVLVLQLTVCLIIPSKKIRKYIVALIASVDLLFFFSRKIYNKHKSKFGISLLHNLKRDYEQLILGRIASGIYDNDKNHLNLQNYCRNFYTDILIMERFYSFLRKDGKVVFNIENDKYYLTDENISIFDAFLLHRVTVYKKNKYIYKYVYDYKEIFTGILFLFKNIINVFKRKCDKVDLDLFLDKVNYIVGFAKVRQLSISLNMKGFSQEFLDYISQKFPEIKIYVCD